MAMPTKAASKKNDPELLAEAKSFVSAFTSSATKREEIASFNSDSGISMGAAGVVEIDSSIALPLRKFIDRAERLLGHNASHRRAIHDTALIAAHTAVAGQMPDSKAASAIIDAVWEQALTTFEWIAPNRVFRFLHDVDQIKIGRVRAMLTTVIISERNAKHPLDKLTIDPTGESGLEFHEDGRVIVQMPHTCWAVDVDAINQHVETEGKWLIDVAISYLRLCHDDWKSNFPNVGDKEPHPINRAQHLNEGVKFQDSKVLAGGGKLPHWYQIDAEVVRTASDPKFIKNADLIFSPPSKSLAERVAQGLGWLTRGRQAEDRAERLLYFFTAIEALLTNDDKTAPVTQTIARHAAVMLTDDNNIRHEISGKIKKLYEFRSALVHTGSRSVSGWVADQAQEIAESLYQITLERVDVSCSHVAFNQKLAAASYGVPWP
ncbi:HEPN domain-containing protein [Agrobacterium tumefaciens]|uniref:HEPN domain-containing protein n=1 Tax=Agrobacterium tumefaciens TaxID=358 RepID=UPI0015742A47|nr:hypothetical protein [Agrobacterium tumefaciens]NTD12093.1 hypothetical protein [Agrobacterium tumefaciens]